VSEFKAGASGESEAQWRQFLAYLFAQSSAGIAQTGVLAGLGVTQTATASAAVVIAKGAAVVQPSLTAGASPLISNADKTLDILTGSPMGGLARNDLVIFNADTGVIEAVIGTPNASPTDPTVSANHIKLARIRNAASATSIPASAIDQLATPTTLSTAVSDTGWVNVAVASGKAGQAGSPPQVRREGKRTSIRWGWANTGIAAGASTVVGTVPQYAADGVTTLRPPRTVYINMVGSTGNQYGMATVDPSGVVTIRAASGLADYFLFPGELCGWWMD
jgi:hypothetical protein